MAVASVNIIFPESEMKASPDIARDIINYFLTIMYFKMITNFITDFTLTTKVNGDDGSVEIVGIDPKGREVFKFAIDDERNQLIGVEQLPEEKNEPAKQDEDSDEDFYRPTYDFQIKKEEQGRNSKYKRKGTKTGTFEEISDYGSDNDFTDPSWEGRSDNLTDLDKIEFVTQFDGVAGSPTGD